jgi:phosphate transport system permease protein
MASSTAAVGAKDRPASRGFQVGETAASLGTMAFAGAIIVITLLVLYSLGTGSWQAFAKFGFGFFTSTAWDPGADKYGALPFIYGTLVTSFLALVIAVPLGVGAAIYLAELAPARLSSALTFLVELLAAVPSVIYGLLAIFVLVPAMRDYVEPALQNTFGGIPGIGMLFAGQIFGVGFLTAAVVLAIMTFPYIISISREALLDVPVDQREAALALGATRWESTFQIVLPNAKLGIVGAVFLGLARALGETMAVTMVIGNDPSVRTSLFASGYTIPSVIANEFPEASGIQASSLIALALVLFLITIVINGGARLFLHATRQMGA